MTAALSRTRTLIANELGLDLGERVQDAYREASGAPLEGEWLGAFAQPSVILNKVTPVSLRIDGATGVTIDEYGEATLAIEHGEQGRVQLTKHYAPSATHTFVYVGRLAGGTLAGYWYSPRRPAFGGVFWFTRAERLEPEVATRLRARVRRTSPRRTLLKVVLALLMPAAAIGMRVAPPLGVGAIALVGLIIFLMRERTEALRREVELWKRQLG